VSGGTARDIPKTSGSGRNKRHRFDLSAITAGIYKTLVVADCSDEDVFGIHYTLQIEK